jgi:PAS domain S-box-containing protein
VDDAGTAPGARAAHPSGRHWAGGLTAGIVAVGVLALALPAGPARAVLMLALNGLTVAALTIGLRRYRPAARGAWSVLLGTQLCSVGAYVVWYLVPTLTGTALPLPSVGDLLFLAVYAGNSVAVALLIRRERSGRDRQTLIDVVLVTVTFAALSWVFLMAPYVRATDLSAGAKAVSLGYPLVDLVLLVLVLRLAVSGSRTTPAKALLLAWAGFQLVADMVYGVLSLSGDWHLGSPVQLGWMAAFLCLAAAALHPSMADLSSPAAAPSDGSTVSRARRVAVVAAVLALPAVLTIRLLTGRSEDLFVIAAASVLVSLLALVRSSGVGGHRDRADRIALAQLVAAFTVFALLPLGLLAESSLRLSQRAVETDARAALRTTSTVSAELVEQRLNGLAQLVESYAERELLLGALGDGTIESYDASAVRRHLGQLQALDPELAAVFVADAGGRLSDVLPYSPEVVGREFSTRDWYVGATGTRGAYVSEAYQTAVTGQPRVVAVAVAVRRPGTGDIAGYLVVTYDLETLRAYSERLADAQGVTLRVTDQRGTVVASPATDDDDLVDVSQDAGVAAALRGEAGLKVVGVGDEQVLSAYAPVPGLGWTVTARIPTATAYASLAPLRSTVLGIVVLLGQVLLAGLVLMARSQHRQREAERELAEREESTRTILDAAADAFVSIDVDGTVTSWSAQSEALFGWRVEQALGRPLVDLIAAPGVRDRFIDAVRRLGDPERQGSLLGQRVELAARHRDGRRFPVELVVWRSVTGGRVSFNSFIHDISSRKRHEAQLASARDEAVEAARVKTEFLAVMSHELRTPLNGVMGMTSLLLSTDLTGRQLEYAETVRSSADALLHLLNDILDLSKVEADRMELEEVDFDLRPVVRDIVHLLAVSAREKGLALEADIDPDVPLDLRGDPARLRQVLLNLVGNAVKFTSTGSVHLHVSLDREAPSGTGPGITLRFAVTDTGIGIPAEARERLFEPFSQADASTTRRFGGTGLGLAISKSLVELFGGTIGVDSAAGAGATFWFTARFDAGTPVEPVSVEPAAQELRRRAAPGLVLVVDDNATNQRIAVRMLETLGHRADVAASGVEAVEACARVPYDLVLMDCRMPIMDGYEATVAIREAEGERRRTPIVAMTASAMAEDRQRCLRVGMDDYVSKPVRLAEVAAKVDHWMPEVPVRVVRAPSVPALHLGAAPGPVAVVGQPVPLDGPVLDEDVVAGLRGLGQDFLDQLVPIFVGGAPARLDDIVRAVRAGDATALREAAHVLRGSAGNLGGARVATVCGRLEDAAAAGSWDRSAADLLALEVELPALLSSVSALSRARA